MKYVLNSIIITIMVIVLCSTTIASQILFEDNFDNNTLNDAEYIYSTDNFVKTPWKIEDGVFISGSSTLPFDVHWQHYVDIRYYSDYYFKNLSITLSYLNTRDYGGRLSVVLGQVDHYGNTIWSEDFRYVNWEDKFNRTLSSRNSSNTTGWKDVYISSEQLLQQSAGRNVNMLFIRELDITNRNGSGYIDNIKIYGTLGLHAPEPTTLVLLGLGLLVITNIFRRGIDYEGRFTRKII